MKKILMLLLALVTLMPTTTYAQSKQLEKERKKEYKAKMKTYKKEGWKLYASSRSLEVALLTHYEKLNTLGENAYELVGVASRFKSKSTGHQIAINDACRTYAQSAGSHVKGRVISDIAADGVSTSGEFDHFYAAYERSVEAEIKGEMQESFSVIREIAPGEYEMETYFVINQDAATRARIRAYENALKESEAAQKYAQKVSDFIKEGDFKKE